MGIAGEAIAQDLVGLLNDDKSVGINMDHQLLQLCQLLALDGCQDHLRLFVAIAALSMEERGAPIQLPANGLSNSLVLG